MTSAPLQDPERAYTRGLASDPLLLDLDLTALEQQFFLEWQVQPPADPGRDH